MVSIWKCEVVVCPAQGMVRAELSMLPHEAHAGGGALWQVEMTSHIQMCTQA